MMFCAHTIPILSLYKGAVMSTFNSHRTDHHIDENSVSSTPKSVNDVNVQLTGGSSTSRSLNAQVAAGRLPNVERPFGNGISGEDRGTLAASSVSKCTCCVVSVKGV